MNPRELDADRMLRALGSLQRAERAELADLEIAAQELASREPERQRTLEERMLAELLAGPHDGEDVEEPPELAEHRQSVRAQRGTLLRGGADERAGAAPELAAREELEGLLKAPRETCSRRGAAECSEGYEPLPSTCAAEQGAEGALWGRARLRSNRLLSTAAASFAMAAAVMLWLRQPEAPPFTVSYTLVAPAPDASSRSSVEQTAPAVYSLGRTLRFALRPSERYEGPLGVTCYAVQDDTVIRLDAQLERDPAGGAHVLFSGAQLGEVLNEGSWQLHFYVAPPSAAEVSPALVRAEHCPRDTRCLSFSARFVQPRAS